MSYETNDGSTFRIVVISVLATIILVASTILALRIL